MKTRFWNWDGDCFELSGWSCVVSLIFAVGCCALAALSLNDVVSLRFAHPSLMDELPFGKVLTLCFAAFFMGFCAFVNAAIFYANLKDAFIGIYNSIFKKQTYKFRK